MLFLYWPKLLMAGNIFWQAQANTHRMHVEKISAVFFWIYLKNIAWQWHANFLQSFNPEKHQIAMCCTTYQVLQLKTLEAQKEAILQRYICIKNFPCPHEWMRMSVLGRATAARILTSSWLLSRHNSSVTLAEFSHTPKEIEHYYLP